MRVLITGGTGFIGYHTALELVAHGHEVRLLVRNPDKAAGLYGDSMPDCVKGDIADTGAMRKALKGCDALVHTAAMVSTDKKDADLVYRTNVDGTRNAIGQAVKLGLGKIVHVSSVTAIFDRKARRLDENSPPGTAENAYGRSKVASERYVRSLQDEGAPVHITYPASVIGPDDPGLTEPHAGLVACLYARAIMPGGNQYVDVRDVAWAHRQLLELDLAPGRYPLGGHFLSWPQLGSRLQKLTGRHLLPVVVAGSAMRLLGRAIDAVQPILNLDVPMSHEASVYATQWVEMDSSKAERELGLTFRPVEESLADAIRWLLDAGHISARLAGRLADQA